MQNQYSTYAYSNFATIPSYISLEDNIYGAYLTSKTRLTSESEGIKFTNPKGKKVTIMLSAYQLTKLTAPQLTAVLLHEVGHNMEVQRNNFIYSTGNVFMTAMSMVIHGTLKNGGVFIKNNSGLRNFYASIDRMFGAIGDLFGEIDGILGKMFPVFKMMGLEQTITKLLLVAGDPKQAGPVYTATMNTFIGAFARHDGEKFSDSYAASYGYSAELREALDILTRAPLAKDMNAYPAVRYVAYANDLAGSVLAFMHSPHPSRINRIANVIKYMEEAAEDTNNPKLKEELLNNIKKEKAMIKAISEDDYEPLIDQMAAAQMIKKGDIKSTDIREIITQYRTYEGSILAGKTK